MGVGVVGMIGGDVMVAWGNGNRAFGFGQRNSRWFWWRRDDNSRWGRENDHWMRYNPSWLTAATGTNREAISSGGSTASGRHWVG